MSDVFIEQLIKQQDSTKTKALKVLIVFCALIVFLIGFVFLLTPFGTVAMLVMCGVGYLSFLLFSGLSLEYEYIYTNGEIDIDRISAKRKRKRITTVKITNFDMFDKYNEEKLKGQSFDVRIMACTSTTDENTYYATFHGKESKRCLLVFTPNDRLLAQISLIAKRKHA